MWKLEDKSLKVREVNLENNKHFEDLNYFKNVNQQNDGEGDLRKLKLGSSKAAIFTKFITYSC